MTDFSNSLNLSSNKFKDKKDLKDLLNLNFMEYVNKTYSSGKLDFPCINCPSQIKVDYLALYSFKKDYKKYENNAVCFFQYDKIFDGPKGLWNSIYYNDLKRLNYYKERFKGVKLIISPDYSLCGDIPYFENLYRIFKARIVSLWFTLVCNIVVIPLLTYSDERTFEYILSGIEETEVIAISLKGVLKNKDNLLLFEKALTFSLNNLSKLKKIIVYSVSINDDNIYKLFQEAIDKGIEIEIPDNLLKLRNKWRNS